MARRPSTHRPLSREESHAAVGLYAQEAPPPLNLKKEAPSPALKEEEPTMKPTEAMTPAVQSSETALALIPKGLEHAFTPEEWGAMSPEDRASALMFFREEDAATTEGLAVTFPRWKFPTSGGTRFILDVENDDAPEEKELRGVIVAKLPGRGYYEPGRAATKGTPPLCASADSVVPDTVPSPVTGAKTCAACPMAQWGSGRDGQGNATRGQACKYRIRTFFIREGLPVPEYISLPPTAGKPLGQYAIQLRQSRIPLIAVETVFGLAKQTSGQGVEFSGLTLKIGRRLSFAEMKAARDMASAFEAHMKRVGVTVEETDGDEPSGNGPTGDVIQGAVVEDPKAGF